MSIAMYIIPFSREHYQNIGQHQVEAADHVAEEGLRGEADHDAADAAHREQRRQIDAEHVHGHQRARQDHHPGPHPRQRQQNLPKLSLNNVQRRASCAWRLTANDDYSLLLQHVAEAEARRKLLLDET